MGSKSSLSMIETELLLDRLGAPSTWSSGLKLETRVCQSLTCHKRIPYDVIEEGKKKRRGKENLLKKGWDDDAIFYEF